MSTSVFFSLKTKMALAIAIILWASSFVGIRAGLEGYSPGALALLRYLIASLCMLFVYLRLPTKARFERTDFCLLLLFGAIGLGLYNVALNYGELTVPSGIASFIISQSPLITVIIAVTYFGEAFSIFTLVGVLISILGVGIISIGEHGSIHLGSGMVAILIATLVNSLYSNLQKPFLNKYHAIDVTVFIIWGCTLALLIYLPNLIHEIPHASVHATLSAIYLGIFPAAIAYLAWSYALAEIPASRAVSFLYFMPIIATLLGWLWLGEMPGILSLMGGLIALLGVWVANRN